MDDYITDIENKNKLLEAELERLKNENAKLKASHNFLSNPNLIEIEFGNKLLNKLPVIIFITDENSCIWINHAVTPVLGYSPKEIINMKYNIFQQLMHMDDIELINSRGARKYTVGENNTLQVNSEFKLLTKSAEWKWFLSTYLVTEYDNQNYTVVIAVDISERKTKELQALSLQKEKDKIYNQEIFKLNSKLNLANIMSDNLLSIIDSLYQTTLDAFYIEPIVNTDKHKELGRINKRLNDTKQKLKSINHDMIYRTAQQYEPEMELLSPTEQKIYALIKQNLSNFDISELLNVSIRTIESHKYNIKKKLSDFVNLNPSKIQL